MVACCLAVGRRVHRKHLTTVHSGCASHGEQLPAPPIDDWKSEPIHILLSLDFSPSHSHGASLRAPLLPPASLLPSAVSASCHHRRALLLPWLLLPHLSSTFLFLFLFLFHCLELMQILVRRLEFALVQSKRTSSSLGSSLSRAPPPHYETLLQPHAFLFQHKVQVRKGGLMEERHREDNSQLSQIFGSNLSNLKLLLWASDRRRGQGVLAACKGGASCSLPRQAAMFRWMEQIQTSKVISLNPRVGVPTSV